MPTIAEAFIQLLEKAGVSRVYGIVGDSLNEFVKVIAKKPDLQWIHVRHEEVAAFAAGAESQLTGELTVCMGSCGPGNLHLINGLYDCHRSQTPVLAIATHIPSAEVGSHYFQETHPNILFKECSCFCEMVSSPEQLSHILPIAMQTAIAKRGVAVLVISGDVATQTISSNVALAWTRAQPPLVVPQDKSLKEAATILNESKKITLFCGIGAAEAHAELMNLAQTLQAPIVHTLRGKPFVEYDNPYDVGMTGFIGFSSGYFAMENCDTLLLIGTSFPYRQFYPQHARIIQIDMDGQQLGKRAPIEVGLIGDVKTTLQALLPLLTPKQDAGHLDLARDHYKKARLNLKKLAVADAHHIHPQYLTSLLDEYAAQDTIFTCDVGTPTVWSARYLSMNGKRRLLGSFNHGSMANALAQGIGAQLSHPTRQVVALCGDGGLSMLLGDLLTLIQHQIPLKVIVFNNQALDFVKLEMHTAGMLDFGTELCATNFAKIAEAAGIYGVRVEKSAELSQAVKQVLEHEGPALLDVMVNPNELIIPPSITFEQVKGFGLYMLKAILDGQGDKILDLAKTELWDKSKLS